MHIRLQVSVCRGYDLCHPGRHPVTHRQTAFWPPHMNSSTSRAKAPITDNSRRTDLTCRLHKHRKHKLENTALASWQWRYMLRWHFKMKIAVRDRQRRERPFFQNLFEASLHLLPVLAHCLSYHSKMAVGSDYTIVTLSLDRGCHVRNGVYKKFTFLLTVLEGDSTKMEQPRERHQAIISA